MIQPAPTWAGFFCLLSPLELPVSCGEYFFVQNRLCGSRPEVVAARAFLTLRRRGVALGRSLLHVCKTLSDANTVPLHVCRALSDVNFVPLPACRALSDANSVPLQACRALADANSVPLQACRAFTEKNTVPLQSYKTFAEISLR